MGGTGGRRLRRPQGRHALPILGDQDARLRFLLEFTRLDLASCSLKQLSLLVVKVFTFWTSEQAAPHFTRGEDRALTALNDGQPGAALAVLEVLQKEVQEGLRLLSEGETWRMPRAPRTWRLELHGTTVVRRYEGPFSEIFLASAADLLVAGWADIRRCGECQEWFLPVVKQTRYCGRRCVNRHRNRDRPRRERDYKLEHARRVARKLPGAKVRHRTTS